MKQNGLEESSDIRVLEIKEYLDEDLLPKEFNFLSPREAEVV